MSVLCFAVALVVVSAVALNINQLRLRESFQWVRHTDEVLLEVGTVAEDLFAAESSERGYLLVGDDDYARTFRRARETIVGRMDALTVLVADNQRQNENLALLRPAMQARLDELGQVVELGPERLDAALAVVRSGKSRQLTALIQEYLARFRRVEIDLLRERQECAEHDTRLSTMLALATTILALLSATLGLFLFQRARSEHRETVLRTELIHVSRLNTMGQMASMLAHELNQPLTATANYLRAMLRMTDTTDPAQSRLAESLRRSGAQMERAREIVQRLRRFIEKGEPSRSAEEIGPIFEEAIALLAVRHDPEAVSCEVDSGLPAVFVDKIQIEQVLINLMRNAFEAMEHSAHRALVLSARAVGGSRICISVADTGPGFSKNVADRLFRPFVSTKSGGMGVGLSICQTIVVAHGGRIWAEPNAGGGAIVRFTLPVAPPFEAGAADVRDPAVRDEALVRD